MPLPVIVALFALLVTTLAMTAYCPV